MDSFFFDTHCHLDLLGNFEEVVKSIEKQEIYTIAVTNLPVLYQKMSEKINSKYIRPALGMHPELVGQYSKYIQKMWDLLPASRYIGEVGLDYKIGANSKSQQFSFFSELIERCSDYNNKVLTIHSRGACKEVVDVIGDKFKGKYILHWYSGTHKILSKAIDNGAYFSINYAMLNSDSGKKIINQIPLDRLLIETDAPFVKHKDLVIDATRIKMIYDRLSTLLNMEPDSLKLHLYNNFKRLLN